VAPLAARHGANRLKKLCAVDRLGEIAGGAKRKRALFLVGNSHHDYGDRGEVRISLERREHSPAVELRHDHVEGDRDRFDFASHFESLDAARGASHLETCID